MAQRGVARLTGHDSSVRLPAMPSHDNRSRAGSPGDIAALSPLARSGQPLLGLDLGSKTIGLAVSDGAWQVASPIGTIKRRKFQADAAELSEICLQRKICGIVLGLPLNMDGSEGPRAQSTRAFAANLGRVLPLPLAFWDERLSTQAVTRTLLEADASRRKRGQVVDQMAAAYILQGALDRLGALT
jgi:putative Holliday junction resolvase